LFIYRPARRPSLKGRTWAPFSGPPQSATDDHHAALQFLVNALELVRMLQLVRRQTEARQH